MPRSTAPVASSARLLRATLAALSISALVAACTTGPSDRPLDVGNMAYPEPLPEGNLSTTAVSGRQPTDTGNMAYPEPVPAGIVGRVTISRQASRQPFDTGSMAYPEPLPVGNGPNTQVR